MKFDIVEGYFGIRIAQQLPAETIAEITRQTNTGTAVTQGVKNTILLTEMREIIEGEADKAHPGMAEFGRFKLRKDSQ